MKKSLSLFCSLLSFVALTSCSVEAKAQKIYEDDSLTNREKIDELYQLYVDSAHHADNSTTEDRVWDAIVNGNYDQALAIIESYDSDSYDYSPLEYIALLQEDMPAPTFSLVVQNGYSTSYYYEVEMDDIDSKSNIYYQIKTEIYDGSLLLDSEIIKTGEFTGLDLDFHRSFDSHSLAGHDNLTYKVVVNPLCGFRFDYYKSTNEYLYTLDVTVSELTAGVYPMECLGSTTCFFD